MLVGIMLKSALGAVRSISGSITKRSVFVSSRISNVRKIGTTRTVLNRDTDHVPGVLSAICKYCIIRYASSCMNISAVRRRLNMMSCGRLPLLIRFTRFSMIWVQWFVTGYSDHNGFLGIAVGYLIYVLYKTVN